MKNNFITKIIGATLAFAMMIGGAVGINAAKEAKEVNAATVTRHTLDTSSTIIATNNSYANYAETSTAYQWAVTCGSKQSSGLWLGANNNQKDKMTLGNGSYSDASGIATACGTNTTSKYYAAIIQRQGAIANVDKVTLTYTTPGGTAPSEAWVLYNDGTGWAVFQKVTSLSTTGTDFSHSNVSSARYAFVIHSTAYCQFKVPVLAFKGTDGSQEQEYTITFNSDGGSSVDDIGVPATGSATAEEPEAPTKRGYTFGGWYTEEEYPNGQSFDFENTPITANLELKAKWNKTDETTSYSLNLENGDYHISGEVTAITGSSEFFIQDGNNVMKIGGNETITNSLTAGNGVDLYGTFLSNNGILSNLAYCDPTSDTDGAISQTPLNSLNDATEANLYKYFEISGVRLSSGFAANKQATISGESVIVFYNSISKVSTDNGSFTYSDYHENDFVYVKGVINKTGSTIGLYITYIEKMTSYVVNFDSNEGTPVDSQIILAGEQVERPTDPTRASDEEYNYTFAGWYDQTLTVEYDFDAAVNSSFTLYAKWERTELTAAQAIGNLNTRSTLTYRYSNADSTPNDTLDRELTGVDNESNTYEAWSEKNATSSAVYAGNSAGLNDSIQLRTNNNNSGVVTTASGGKAKAITVVWETHTQNGRKLDIYGKTSAYSSAADLYSANASTQGTLLGTITYGTSTSLTITGDYTYIGFRSNNGALYLTSVEIQWEKTTYTYSNVGIRYGGLISTSLWNKLNTESTIEGYGVVFSTITTWNDDSLSDYIGEADNTSVWNFYTPLTSKAHPDYANSSQKGDTEEEYYVWSLFKNVSADDTNNFKVSYTGVAYIKTAAGYVFFNQTISSVKSLATGLLATSEYNENSLEGSLYNLANL